MNKLAEWYQSATPQERKKLIYLSNVCADTIYKVSNGSRKASAEVAARLEVALAALERPPDITRADICDACSKCPYAIKCLKKG